MDDVVKKDLTFDSGQPHAPGANWCWQLLEGGGGEKKKGKRKIDCKRKIQTQVCICGKMR